MSYTEITAYDGTYMIIIIGRIAVLRTYMRPIVTDRGAWSVGLSVSLSVCHTNEPCKTAKAIELPFGLKARMGPRNHVLHGVQIPHDRGNFEGKRANHCKVYRDTLRLSVQKRLNRSGCHLGCGLALAQGIMC